MSDITIKQPQSEDEFAEYYNLRYRLLRQSWGEAEGSEKDNIEDDCFHIIAKVDDRVIGVGRLQYNNDTEAQIRYMAVETEHERTGIGKLIVDALEKQARDQETISVVLDAREPAVGFYEKLGYKVIEKSYLLFDSIQHFRMQKCL